MDQSQLQRNAEVLNSLFGQPQHTSGMSDTKHRIIPSLSTTAI